MSAICGAAVVVLSPRTVSYLPLMPHSALGKEIPSSIMALGALGAQAGWVWGLVPALLRGDEIGW